MVEALFAKMNRMPTMWQAGVYSSVMHYLNAVKEAGTDEPLKVAAKMRETPIEDFFSRNGKLREDGLMVHDLVLVQVKKPEEFEISLGLLPGPHPHSRRAGVRAARSGLPAGQAVSAAATAALGRLAEERARRTAAEFDLRRLSANSSTTPTRPTGLARTSRRSTACLTARSF